MPDKMANRLLGQSPGPWIRIFTHRETAHKGLHQRDLEDFVAVVK